MRGADASMADGESSSALERQVRYGRSTVQLAASICIMGIICQSRLHLVANAFIS